MDSVLSVRVEREEGGMNKNFTTLTKRMRGLGLCLRRLLGDSARLKRERKNMV